MAKYAIFFTYSSDAWARMINSPGDRTAAVRQLLASIGGNLEYAYWMFGAHDGFVVADVPDSVRAAALSVAVGSSGSFKRLETHELFTQDQLGQILSHAKDATNAYQPPGQLGSSSRVRGVLGHLLVVGLKRRCMGGRWTMPLYVPLHARGAPEEPVGPSGAPD
jgi:uncharacterized protein with GYD domain